MRKYDEAFWDEVHRKREEYRDYDPNALIMKTQRAEARGRFTEDGEFEVLKGSKIAIEVPPSTRATVRAIRAAAFADGTIVDGILQYTKRFHTKASAMNFVVGGNAEWKQLSGNSWDDNEGKLRTLAEQAYYLLTDEQIVVFDKAYNTLLCEVSENYFARAGVDKVNAKLKKLAKGEPIVIDEAILKAMKAREKYRNRDDDNLLDLSLANWLAETLFAFNETEHEIFEKVCDLMDKENYPVDIFATKNTEELKQIFDIDDKVVFTKKLKVALDAERKLRAFDADEITNGELPWEWEYVK